MNLRDVIVQTIRDAWNIRHVAFADSQHHRVGHYVSFGGFQQEGSIRLSCQARDRNAFLDRR